MRSLGKTEDLLHEAIDLADKKLKEGSPYDTGRLKASWLISENRPDGQPHPEGKYPNTVLHLRKEITTAGRSSARPITSTTTFLTWCR